MKIRNKILFIMIGLTIILVEGTLAIVLRLYQTRVENEKLELHNALAQQILVSFDLLSDDIEYGLFDNAINEGIPQLLVSESSDARRFSLTSKLRMIALSSDFVTNLVVVDLQGDAFQGGTRDDIQAQMIELYQYGFFSESRGLSWKRDEQGNVYFHRMLNNLYPYRPAGELIAAIDLNTLLTTIGMDQFDDVNAVIYNKAMQPVLLRNDELMDETLANNHAHVLSFSLSNREWSIKNYVEHSTLFSTVRELAVSSALLGSVLVLCAAILSLLLSRALTRNIDALIRRTTTLGEGDFTDQLPVQSKDEIGVLTTRFNLMSRNLQELNHRMLVEVQTREKARYELLELKYQTLQNKISPHFICNVLANINALAIVGEAEKVEKLSYMASEYLRANLRNNDQKTTTVSQELQLLSDYVSLYHNIFRTRFVFNSLADPAVTQERIPAFILQPLVENALKHGMKGIGQRTLQIDVCVEMRNDCLALTVRDDGCGIDARTLNDVRSGLHKGYGLYSVTQRLKLLYGDAASIEIDSVQEKYNSIELLIPKRAHMENQ